MSTFPENFKNEFDNFLTNLNSLFDNNDILTIVTNETIENKVSRIYKLHNSLNTTTNFNNFCKSKIKVFSHKDNDTMIISESVFGKNLSLKKIFNNQPDNVKDLLWTNLHKLLLFVIQNENSINPSKLFEDKINKLNENFKNIKLNQTKKSLQHIFQTDKLNSTTNNMISDIFQSFETAMSGENTMENILQLSSQLTQKYEDKITNGEIDLNGLLNGLKTNIPGMEGMKDIIDPLLNMENLLGSSSKEPVEKIIIDENFSTSNIEIGTLEENNSKPMFGDMLRAADNTGLLGMLTGEQSESFNKLLGVVNKLKDSGLDNKDEISDILKNDLGIDMEKITNDVTKLMNNNNVVIEE